MAGTALYGDLLPLMASSGPVPLTHQLESVKILPDEGENPPKLYGAITRESIARAEVQASNRRRAVCMAVTSDLGTNVGRPSSWSAAVDQLCFGVDTTPKLVLISAGNIRDNLSKADYPARNQTEPIENPAQAWNAITVGAYTQKATLVDPSYADWEPIAPVGGLSPASRTSLTWEKKWPAKPDVVLEGGNWAALGDQCDCPDDLGLLTTYRDPTTRYFDIFRDTSAATAIAGNLAGKILAAVPERWPETIRALIVHSAEWTPVMKQQFDSATSEQQRRAVLRQYGYGVPSYERAIFSALNDLTLIAEDELQPLWKDNDDGVIKSRHMNLHQFPWPRTELEQLEETEVELRVTLSYYVEPNPGERGWLRRHRYPSQGLRFAVKRSLESVGAFRQRINEGVAAEEDGIEAIDTGPDNWLLGRIRDAGSIHSDHWRGTAVELARRSAIGVYPIGGWWKENPAHKRYERTVRYSLIISIRAVNGDVDIYTPVQVQNRNADSDPDIIWIASRKAAQQTARGRICLVADRAGRRLQQFCAAIRNLLDFGVGRSGRAFAHDFEDHFFVFSAVPMDLLAKVRHVAARGHGHGDVRIVLRSGAHPPGAGKNINVPVVGVEMGAAHVMREPLGQLDVDSRFVRIARQDCVGVARVIVRRPLDLVRVLDRDRRRVELGFDRGQPQKNRRRASRVEKAPQRRGLKHASSLRTCCPVRVIRPGRVVNAEVGPPFCPFTAFPTPPKGKSLKTAPIPPALPLRPAPKARPAPRRNSTRHGLATSKFHSSDPDLVSLQKTPQFTE